MSSFFDDASLVTIPSGYKDGKVYSVKPTSGAGDLTFTRNSNATRVDADGLVEKVRTNSLLQSNSFNTTWTNFNSSETSGQAGYDSSTDAWLLTKTGANGNINQFVSSSGVNTFSIYAKGGTKEWILVRIGGSLVYEVYFDIANGIIGGETNVISSDIESIGNGYYRCSVTANVSSGSYVRLYVADSDGDTSGTSGNIYIQDAQLEQGLVATSYIETTTTAMSEFAGVTASSVADVPRLDYSGGSCPSLLLEPQRTNSLNHSEYIESWAGANTTRVTNAGISPEGVNNATSLTFASGGYWYKSVAGSYTAGSSHTWSIYANTNTRVVQWGGFTPAGTDTYNIVDAGNGWYRQSLTRVTSGSGSGTFQPLMDSYYIGVGVEFKVYGAQLEYNASYPTSYIPTYGTTVTRLADKAYKTGISSLIGSDAGTIYLEAAALANDLSERRFALSDGTTSNVARIGFTSVSNRILAVLYNGSNQCVLTYNGGDITAMNKIAFTWATNDFALFVNGVKRASDVSGSTFAANTLNALHFNEGDGSGNEIEGKFDKVILFTSRLSDTELENLTA